MSTSVTDLVAAIKLRAADVLGSGYSEIGFAMDVSKNTFNGNKKRFGVVPGSANEISSITRYSTISQTFELILTDSFINKPLSDSEQQSRASTLQDLAFDVYRNLILTRCGSPVTCINVSEFNLSEPETLDQEKVVVQRARFSVIYRQPL